MDRNTWNMLVYNKMVRHLLSTKSGDLYYEQVGVVIGSVSCFLIHASHCEGVARLT